MKNIAVSNSSIIDEFGYIPERQELMIRFKGGRVYKYTGVSEAVVTSIEEAIKNGQSIGSFYSRVIKGKFPATKM